MHSETHRAVLREPVESSFFFFKHFTFALLFRRVQGWKVPSHLAGSGGGRREQARCSPSTAVRELRRPDLRCLCFAFSKNILGGRLLLDLLS